MGINQIDPFSNCAQEEFSFFFKITGIFQFKAVPFIHYLRCSSGDTYTSKLLVSLQTSSI